VVSPDPVDARLLAVIAEMGRAAVHEVAARLGMDPREAASRLITLSGSGLPLLVGVECDPNGIRQALSNSMAWGNYNGPPAAPRPYLPYQSPPSVPFPAQQQPQPQQTWGPPQTAAWARTDQQPMFGGSKGATGQRTGKIGTSLETEGLEGATFSIQLIEVVDPADFLFTAAGYKLADGERAVVVHTELTNTGTIPFNSLPDMYLVLMARTSEPVTKAPVSLSSRPPHKIGVQPGETAGGHTVYVLPEDTAITAVRWSARPETDLNTLVWTIDD
jgi:DNA-binding Lrp family transcriptional regulator